MGSYSFKLEEKFPTELICFDAHLLYLMMGPRGACRRLVALKQHGASLSLILVGFDVLVVGCCDCERDDTTPGGTPVVLNPPIGSGIGSLRPPRLARY